MAPPDRPAEPWLSFLTDLDAALDAPADFHCIGGFVVSQYCGFARETADLDVLTVLPRAAGERVTQLAGKDSALHKKHRVYIDRVGVANYPADYEDRLIRVFPIWPMTKLERSNDRDIRDVMFLAQAGLIARGILVSRFETELEPYITGRTPTWNRTTLKMWINACWPE
jgi:hypothetical protein